MVRARALPARRTVSPMAADDRRARGREPPALGDAPRGVDRARGAGRAVGPAGGAGADGARRAAARTDRRAADRARPPGAARPRGRGAAPCARPVRARDRRRARLPAGHREVAAVARAGAPARRPRGAAMTLERELAALADHVDWPATPDFAGRLELEPRRASRRRRGLALVLVAALAGAAAVPDVRAA